MVCHVRQSVNQLVSQSVLQSVRTSVSVPVGQTVKQLVSEAVRPFLHPSVSQPTGMSVSKSFRPSGSHSVNQLNQSVRPFSISKVVSHTFSGSVRSSARDCPLWSRAKINTAWSSMERTYKVRNFWTLSATEKQKALEDSRNKENINDSRGFIVLQTHLAFGFLSGEGGRGGSRNKQVILIVDSL